MDPLFCWVTNPKHKSFFYLPLPESSSCPPPFLGDGPSLLTLSCCKELYSHDYPNPSQYSLSIVIIPCVLIFFLDVSYIPQVSYTFQVRSSESEPSGVSLYHTAFTLVSKFSTNVIVWDIVLKQYTQRKAPGSSETLHICFSSSKPGKTQCHLEKRRKF